jgi:hypothetical protein
MTRRAICVRPYAAVESDLVEYGSGVTVTIEGIN